MFKYVHHVHYVVRDLDAMLDYLEQNFGMKPNHRRNYEAKGLKAKSKEANYDNIGQTTIQISQPLDDTSHMGKHLKEHGPGVFHVAWGVDSVHAAAIELAAKGNKLGGKDGTGRSPRGYPTCNIDPASSLGVWFQLAEGEPTEKS